MVNARFRKEPEREREGREREGEKNVKTSEGRTHPFSELQLDAPWQCSGVNNTPWGAGGVLGLARWAGGQWSHCRKCCGATR
jgi:hypothetical protein